MTIQESPALRGTGVELERPSADATPPRGAGKRRRGLRVPGRNGSNAQSSRGARAQVLRLGDAIALFIGFSVPLLVIAEVSPVRGRIALTEAAIVTLVGLWSMRLHGLWSTQVTSVRSVEFSHLLRALATLSAACLVLDRKSPTTIRVSNLIVACLLGLVVLIVWRSAYRAFLNAERRRGRNTSKVVIIGTGRQANVLRRLFNVHPELGLRVDAVVGSEREAANFGFGHLWRGNYEETRDVVMSSDASIVMLCAAELDNSIVTGLIRDVRASGRTLYVDPGLSGVDFKRMHATAIGHQPVLEMTSVALTDVQTLVKRAFDMVVAGFIAVLTLPVVGLIAALIKLEDRGPVLFRQRRVGLHGAEFEMLKFRTMVVGAEARLADLTEGNERVGPLFKMDGDPRITRIGRFLRATSLDELPQLFNVLNGTMSLVGPRPALPLEVAEFPPELNARHEVRPGITGLWQVEARDNPAFEAYLRLDLFYVQNWSLALDLIILLGTLDHLFLRPLVKVVYRGEDQRRREAIAALDAIRDEGVAVL
jgi:exopolysaccharide biosynthesis polyprenyl glycosylphosphotransferase